MFTLFQGLATDPERQKIVSRQMSETECEELQCYNARFGFSLASMGDMDRDGYEGRYSLRIFWSDFDEILKEILQNI